VTQSATAMTFDQALETLIAISIAQLAASGRSDNRRLQEALMIATNYLELAPTPPAIGSSSLLKNPRHGESVVIQFSVTNRRRLACGAHL
jgi:hypothetical protein